MSIYKKGCDFIIISENLRKKVAQAYLKGQYDKALKLSQKLDKQILKYYNMHKKS
jgi:hypothetical protein